MLRPPFNHLLKVVAAAALLLLARLDARAVDQGDPPQDGRGHRRRLELVEIVRAVVAERVEWRVRLRGQRVARRHLLAVAVHDRDEPVGRRLGADVLVGKVAAEQIADEGGLADRVLADEQHHRPRVEPRVAQLRLAQLVVHRLFLERPELLRVEVL